MSTAGGTNLHKVGALTFLQSRMPLRLLFLEDAHEDAELEQRVLRRAGILFEALLVRDRAGFLRSLQTFQPDLVIADYSLSDINGLSAIELAREWDANLPVLLVTGALDDEAAAEVVKAGAYDYLRKDRLARLPLAIEHALAAAEAVKARRASEKRLRQIVELMPNALVMTNQSGLIAMLNAQSERLFGYSRSELLGKPVEILVPERFSSDHPGRRSAFSSDLQARPMGAGRELLARRKDGSEVPVEIELSPIETDDGTMMLFAVLDIADRKQREERLRTTLREKEFLLAEVHHRVKNNLQIISSLLNLQFATVDDNRVLALLRECQNRIRSMSLIHQTLYESNDVAEVDFGQFLDALVPTLVSAYATDQTRVSIDIDLPSVMLPISFAIPCGLIVNELISNALKHGFPGDRRGRVRVALENEQQNCVSLSVSDDGVGIPAEADTLSPATLGLQIVNVLIDQLGGVLDVNPRAPTQFKVQFSLPSPYKRPDDNC